MKKKLLSAVIVVFLVSIVFFVFLTEEKENNNFDKFIGKWIVDQYEYGYVIPSYTEIFTFYENRTVKKEKYYECEDIPKISFNIDNNNKSIKVQNIEEFEYSRKEISWYSYHIKNDVISFSLSDNIKNFDHNYYGDWHYKFSENESEIDIYQPYEEGDFSINRISLAKISKESQFYWKNVNITLEDIDEDKNSIINLTRSNVSYNNIHSPDIWGEITIGDVIKIDNNVRNFYIRLNWIPNNKEINHWFISENNTIYVGGKTSNSYDDIQDAINNSNNGDVIYVYSGEYRQNYRQEITVDKSIKLLAEDENTTLYYKYYYEDEPDSIIKVVADSVTIKGFKFEFNHIDTTGIKLINVTNCQILSNYFTDIYNGVILLNSGSNVVKNNTFKSINNYGIYFNKQSESNIVKNNTFKIINDNGIKLDQQSNNNIIESNYFKSNQDSSILINNSNNNIITLNNFSDHHDSIIIYDSQDNHIYHNNIFSTMSYYWAHDDSTNNSWDNGYPSGGNYWKKYTGLDNNNDGIGDTPYDIFGLGNNKDQYPLMSPVDI